MCDGMSQGSMLRSWLFARLFAAATLPYLMSVVKGEGQTRSLINVVLNITPLSLKEREKMTYIRVFKK